MSSHSPGSALGTSYSSPIWLSKQAGYTRPIVLITVKLSCDRNILDHVTFDEKWVNATGLVVENRATLESSFPPLSAHRSDGSGPMMGHLLG